MGKTQTIILKIAITVAIFLIAIFFAMKDAFALSDGVVLTVKLDGKTEKTFTLEDLQNIAADEGNKTYFFSAWNTFPTAKIEDGKDDNGVVGPTVEAVLKSAGVYSNVADDCVVEFSDGAYITKLTGYQLLREERYYYPILESYQTSRAVRPGNTIVNESHRAGRVIVPAVICLNDDQENTKLCIGQVEPNEENNPAWVEGLAKGGYINVTTKKAQKCASISGVSAHVKPNEGICFLDFPDDYSRSSSYANDTYYDKVYYSIGDGISVGYGSAIYNNGPQNDEINKPAFTDKGKYKINILVKGYGKLDSDITSFEVSVCDGEIGYKKTYGNLKHGLDIYFCTTCGYYKSSYHAGYSTSYVKSLKLAGGSKRFTAKWTKQSSKNQAKFSGYQIRYCKSGGKWSSWKNVKKSASSVTIKKLSGKAKYTVQVRSYVKKGKEVYYSKTTQKSVKTKA